MDSRKPPSPASAQADLSRFGYAQELFRSMGGFSNFAISFNIISILTGAVTLFGYGLEMGGPLQMSAGWPVATLFTLFVAMSMAELCSAYPTSGAMYHWCRALGHEHWAWFAAWFNIAGLIAAVAGIDYSCAQFILPFLGLESTPGNLYLMFAFILLNQSLINIYSVRLVAILGDISVTVHILGVIAIAGALYLWAPLQPVSFLWTAENSNHRSPYWWAFLLGLLQAQWTYTGFDASAHMAEETTDPRRHAPWGIVMSVAISGVVGYLLIIPLTLAIQSIPEALAAKDSAGNAISPAIAIFRTALGAKAGNMMSALASAAMWFCGLSAITNTSRTVFSLARDRGTPFSGLFRRVNPRHGTPIPAIWAVTAASLVAMAWTGAVPVVTSLSTVALYVAYIIPVILGLRARLSGSKWPEEAVWRLGRYGVPVNIAAIAFAVFVSVILVMPPNELGGFTFAGVLAALLVTYPMIRRGYLAGYGTDG